MRPHFAQVLGQFLETLGEPGAGTHPHRAVQRNHLLGNVAEWQVAEKLIVLVDGKRVDHRLGCPDQVVMREHHRLGRPGGARGVDQGRKIVGLLCRDPVVEP